jgi:hypothetical protein
MVLVYYTKMLGSETQKQPHSSMDLYWFIIQKMSDISENKKNNTIYTLSRDQYMLVLKLLK